MGALLGSYVKAGNYEKTIKKEGKKDDKGKLRWDLLPYSAINEIAKVITFGKEKYGPNNWQYLEEWKFEAALMRHYFKYKNGEYFDEESGLSHLSHMACNVLFLIWKGLVKGEMKNG